MLLKANMKTNKITRIEEVDFKERIIFRLTNHSNFIHVGVNLNKVRSAFQILSPPLSVKTDNRKTKTIQKTVICTLVYTVTVTKTFSFIS